MKFVNMHPLNSRRSPSHFDNPLVFLHVPKTAGTTLWLALRRQYGPRAVLRIDRAADLAALEEAHGEETRVLLGHLAYGLHHFDQTPTYVTILREPLERTLSQYSHEVRAGDGALSLETYLNARLPGLDNLQTRMLAGPEAQALPFGQCDRAVFEEAKRNLMDNVTVVGVTERFDETILLLQRRFGWGLPCYVPENVGANRINREDVPRDQLRQIWEMTRWDRELYALAVARLDESIVQEGLAFADALRRFRIANVRYRRMRSLITGPVRALKSHLSVERQMGLESVVRSILNVGHWHDGGEQPGPGLPTR